MKHAAYIDRHSVSLAGPLLASANLPPHLKKIEHLYYAALTALNASSVTAPAADQFPLALAWRELTPPHGNESRFTVTERRSNYF